jgi:hypothetical protein
MFQETTWTECKTKTKKFKIEGTEKIGGVKKLTDVWIKNVNVHWGFKKSSQIYIQGNYTSVLQKINFKTGDHNV